MLITTPSAMAGFQEVCAVLTLNVIESVRPKVEGWLPMLSALETEEVRALAVALGSHKTHGRKREASAPSHGAFSVRSSYEEAYGSQDLKQSFKTEILRHRRLQELPCSSVLTAKGVQTLQAWLDRAEPALALPVLSGLRMLYSLLTVKVRPPTSNNRMSYNNFSPEDFRRSTTRTEFFPSRRRPLRASFRESLSPTPIKTQVRLPPTTVERPRPRGAHMLSDRRLLAYGEGETNPASLYQKTYVTHYFKYNMGKLPDYHTSLTHSLIPDLSQTSAYV